MAEETNLSVAPQKNTLKGKNSVEESSAKTKHLVRSGSATLLRSASFGSSSHGHSSGRSSPGKLNTPTPNYKQDVSPRYLRASMESCHDLCKYGRRVTDEPKPWRSLPKRNRKPPADMLVSKKPPVSVERMKAMPMKHMHATNAQSVGLNLPPNNVTDSDKPPKIIEREVLYSTKNVELSSKGKTENFGMRNTIKSSDTSTNDPSMIQREVVPMQSESSDASQGKLRMSTRNGVAKDVKSAVISRSLSSVGVSQKKLMSRRNSISSGNRTAEASKSSLNNVKAHSNNLKLSTTSVCKTGNVNADRTRKPVQNSPNTKPEKENLHVNKTVTGTDVVESSVNRDGLTSFPGLEIVKSRPGPLSSPGCDQVEDEKIDIEEKGNDDDDDDGAPLTINKTSMLQNGKEIVKGNPARQSQTRGVIVSKDEDSSPRKLKFRRGMTIELQSDNSGPRKLKFRRGKVQLINQENEVDVMKNFTKEAVNDEVGVDSKSRKVVLRHKFMEGKKDGQGLFNNVIEETASKLVQSRKSKVKALVGAFETVISLQESKPDS